MNINHFTPAQTLMITKPLGVSGAQLIKYSFLDLVYRGVLKVYKEWRLPHPNSHREILYTYVCRGDRFESYVPSFHQEPFVKPFIEDNYEYQVRTLVKKVYKKSGKGAGFKSKFVYKQLKNEEYFNSSFGLKHLNLFFLNNHGKKVRKAFKTLLEQSDKDLPKYINSDSDKVKEILTKLGSNVLLLDSFNDELIAQLKPLFKDMGTALKEPSEVVGSFDYIDSLDFVFYAFLDTLDSFDSSFDSLDTSFDFGSSDFGGGDYGGGGDFGGGDGGGGDF